MRVFVDDTNLLKPDQQAQLAALLGVDPESTEFELIFPLSTKNEIRAVVYNKKMQSTDCVVLCQWRNGLLGAYLDLKHEMPEKLPEKFLFLMKDRVDMFLNVLIALKPIFKVLQPRVRESTD